MYIQLKASRARSMVWLFVRPLLFSLVAPLVIANQPSLSFNQLGRNGPSLSGEQLFSLISSEYQYFSSVMPGREEPSMLGLGAELATNIRFDDIRSLLGAELPGLQTYHAHILVAGDGTNFTNLPIESSPPMEVLLTEREMAQEELAILNEEKVKTPVTPHSKEAIFIYHTHSYESYFPLLGLENMENASRASDSKTNIILIGELLGNKLEENGINTIVDKTNMGSVLKERGWTTSRAYTVSREIVKSAMGGVEKPAYYLDIHRDALRKDQTTVSINNVPYAKVAFVIGEENPDFEQNAAFALKLHQYLEEKYPGLSRGLIGKQGSDVNGVYNQDLTPHSLIVEMGGVDNNMEELTHAVEALADAISDYYWKAEKVNGEN
ncbi:stage II sporulation protein P [Bacillus pinisoli]|uniref:stage II sporulation protein P n=1 Tax=Bacillus pinisoli TaxID=2901866 RepID=UPI001FF43CC0|nr:stage II sporulation protein P [Bacillus pinisoli]